MVADERSEHGDVCDRFVGQRPTGRQMVFVSRRTRIVGGKKAGRSVAVVQLPPALSVRITARIQEAGTPNRCSASATNPASGSAADSSRADSAGEFGSPRAVWFVSIVKVAVAAATNVAVPTRRDQIEMVSAARVMTGKEKGIGLGDRDRSEERRQIGGMRGPIG